MIKETIYNLRHQPVVTVVTVTGTALSIFLIMVFVMMNQVRVAPFAPESNRDRFLHYNWLSFKHESWSEGSDSNGPMAWKVVNDLFYTFKSPEAVAAYTSSTDVKSVGIQGEKTFAADVRETNSGYFDVFDFSFVSGRPFSREEEDAGLPLAVIDTNVARTLFGTEQAEGKRFQINGGDYSVVGVVRPVSPIADRAYAHVWINTQSTDMPSSTWAEIGGSYTVTMLVPDGKTAGEVKGDFNRHFEAYNSGLGKSGWTIINRNRPYTQEKLAMSDFANVEPDLETYRKTGYTIYAILLLVPAINLAGMTHSRMRRRVGEIAVRRAFGATRFRIFSDIITENMLITLAGGLIGLLLSLLAAFGFGNVLFAMNYNYSLSPVSVNPSMLLQWSTFGWALLFCFILNLLSAGLPAIQMSRIGLVNSLRGGANK